MDFNSLIDKLANSLEFVLNNRCKTTVINRIPKKFKLGETWKSNSDILNIMYMAQVELGDNICDVILCFEKATMLKMISANYGRSVTDISTEIIDNTADWIKEGLNRFVQAASVSKVEVHSSMFSPVLGKTISLVATDARPILATPYNSEFGAFDIFYSPQVANSPRKTASEFEKLDKGSIADSSTKITQDKKNKPKSSKNLEDETKKIVLTTFGGKEFELDNEPIWFYAKNRKEWGPFSFTEMLDLVKEGTINRFLSVRKKYDSSWRKINDISEFNTDVIKKIVTVGDKQVEKVFTRRKHPRAPAKFKAQVILNSKKIDCSTDNISEGGVLLIANEQAFRLHDRFQLGFLMEANASVVKAEAKVVFCTNSSPQRAGIQFTNISKDHVNQIRDFVAQSMAENET